MVPKLKRTELKHEISAEEQSWKPVGSDDPAVDEDHELPAEEPKQPMPTPLPAD